MSTQFECRLLLEAEYRAAVRDLERVAAGDNAALRAVQRLRRVEELPGDASAAEQIAEIYIALVAMPEFQLAYEYGTEKSPNLVVLAERDGGLYGVLCKADPWFEDLLIDRFPRSPVKYAVGRAMIALNEEDVTRLQKTVENVSPENCAGASAPEACWLARSRLASLVARSLSIEGGMLPVGGPTGTGAQAAANAVSE